MSDIQNKLLDYFEDVGSDISTGLTSKKFLNRATNIKEANGKLNFSMERHQGILGSTYTRGAPLSAYIEWEELYEFDPTTRTITVLGETEKKVQVDKINFSALAEEADDESYSFEETTDDGVYIFSSAQAKINTKISSLEEAIEIIKNVENVDVYLQVHELSIGELPENVQMQIVKRMISEVIKLNTEKVQKAWEDFFSDIDDDD